MQRYIVILLVLTILFALFIHDSSIKYLVLNIKQTTVAKQKPIAKVISPTPVEVALIPFTPTPAARPIVAVVHSASAESGDAVVNFIMSAINNYRAQVGKSPVTTNAATCSFARTRAQEVAQNFNHDGFNSRVAAKTIPYGNFSYITENIARNSDYKNVVDAWIASPKHAENMRADTPFVCVEYSSNYYVYEGLKP
ncbi:MAG TPA: CAP domain-containing protein [Patescibacteria group bacterium]|nr:CAP domain-containing protein [Patescibacteria group bacterium]